MLFSKWKNNVYSHKNALYSLMIFADNLGYDDNTKMIVELANYLVLNNINVLIVTKQINQKRLLDYKVNFIEENKLFKKNIFFNKQKFLIEIYKTYHIEAILSFSINNLNILYNVANKYNIPIILNINKFFDIKRSNFRYYKVIEKFNAIIIPYVKIGNFLLKYYKIDHSKLHIVINSVNNDIFNNDNITNGRVEEVIKLIGYECVNKKIFLCPSYFGENDGYFYLLKAISQINDKDDKNFLFIILLDFKNISLDEKNKIFEFIKELKIEKYVKILNQISDISALYTLSYATLYLPQNNYNINVNAVIESCFLKKPVIITFSSSLSEYVINKKTGFIIRMNSVDDIATAINHLLSLSREEYQQMCEQAKEYANKYFCIGKKLITINKIIMNEIINKSVNNK